jgi:dCTP deaminase
MSVLSDVQIRLRCMGSEPMIIPFLEDNYKDGEISSGLGTAGYDIMLGTKYKVMKATACSLVDPKRFRNDPSYVHELFDEFEVEPHQQIAIPPHGFILGHSIETFHMPDDVLGVAIGKSSYARIGVHVYITPIENGWRGQLVIEISNTGSLPACVYANEGIAQILFHPIFGEIGKTYATKHGGKAGKYQNQSGIMVSKV